MSVAFLAALAAGGVRLAVPTLLAAIGELVSERAGVLNLGLEGMMISGALASFLVASATGQPLLGLAAGVIGGTAIGLAMVLAAVRRKGSQLVTGFALTVFALGATGFLFDRYGKSLTPIHTLPDLPLPFLSGLPVLGRALFDQNGLVYFSIVLVALVTVILRSTRFGLEATATGHDPTAAHAKGVDVRTVQSAATLFASACAGLGGAAVTLGSVGNFGPGVTAGRGFVAIAVVILGRWQPGWTLLGAMVFGVADSLQLRLQGVPHVPTDLLPALPWLVVVGLLIIGARWTRMPAALGRDLSLES